MTNAAHRRPFSCLVLDDDTAFAGMVQELLREQGGEVVYCSNLKEARQRIEAQSFDFACIDNKLPDGTGFDFYPTLSQRCPDCVIVMITGAPELAQAVQLTRNGLFDYLTKPLNTDEFLACVQRAGQRMSAPPIVSGDDDMVGRSPVVREAVNVLRQAARHATATVLLLGETGTGKDLAARLLHRLTFGSANGSRRYVALNCPAVPGEMFEAELFGSERGAYTGADKRRTGLVEAAEGGTLFLDEVTEIPLPIQAKLLRFLESREYRPLGGTTTHQFTGRVVAATNRSLEEEVRHGRFRQDLLYRLDVTSVRIPSLRERLSDVPALAELLLGQLCAKYQRRQPALRPGDLQALCGYRFPGNIRELRNILERSLLRTPEDAGTLVVDLSWLRPASPEPAPSTPGPAAPTSPAQAAMAPAADRLDSSAASPIPARALSPLDQQEYELIQRVLREENGAIRRSATRLGLTHQALLRRLQKWPELRQSTDS